MRKTHDTLLQEIQEQPALLREIYTRPIRHLANLVSPHSGMEKITGIAEGSSRHALEIAAPFIEDWVGLPMTAHSPEELEEKLLISRIFGANPQSLLSRTLFIAVSQSGKTGSVLRILDALTQTLSDLKFPIFTMSNRAKSTLSETYGNHLYLSAGEEKSIAATKTMTASLFLLLLWGLYAGRKRNFMSEKHYQAARQQLQTIPDTLEELWNGEHGGVLNAIEKFSRKLTEVNHFILLSKGPLCLILSEVGLKLTETSSNIVYTDNTESFKHGPKVILSGVKGEPPNCIYLIPPDQALADGLFKDIRSHFWPPDTEPDSPPAFETHRVFFLTFENSPPLPAFLQKGLSIGKNRILTLPKAENLLESLFLALVTFQIISYDLAHLKGENPNNPVLEKAVTE